MKIRVKQLLVNFLSVVLVAGFVQQAEAKSQRQYQRDVLLHLDQGGLFLEANQYNPARDEFQKAIELDSNCPDAFNNLGLTFYRQGDLVNASKNYMKALEIEPLFVPSLSNLAAVRYQQGKFADAANLYRLALRLANNKDPQLQYNLANVLRDDKDYSEAEQHYKEAIKLKPDFAFAYNGLGATYYCLSDFEKAEEEVKKAISLKKDYSLAYYHLGLIYTSQNEPEKALSAYQNSLKFEKNKSYAADTQKKINELKQSRSEVASLPVQGTAQAGSPEKVSSYLETGRYENAESLMAPLVKGKYANDPSFWNSLGYARLMQNKSSKVEESINCFEKAIELSNGTLIEAHYNLALAYKATNKWMSAKNQCIKAIEEARKQEKLCPLVHNLHGIILKHSGDLKGAESAYRIAIAQAIGKLPVAHYNRALVLEKLQKSKEAAREYQNYLRDAPDGANTARAKRRLSMLLGR